MIKYIHTHSIYHITLLHLLTVMCMHFHITVCEHSGIKIYLHERVCVLLPYNFPYTEPFVCHLSTPFYTGPSRTSSSQGTKVCYCIYHSVMHHYVIFEYIIGERERANLVVRIYNWRDFYFSPAIPNKRKPYRNVLRNSKST